MYRPSLLLALAASSAVVSAYPGMKKLLDDLLQPSNVLSARSQPAMPLPGNLATLSDRDLSPAGLKVKSILQGHTTTSSNPLTKRSYTPPGTLNSTECASDTCCVYHYILTQTMTSAFSGCGAAARAAIRLGFHDAAAWDTGSSYGGADGSILLTDELDRSPDNDGLAGFGATMRGWYDDYAAYGAGMADMIQLGAIAAAKTCPNGPLVTFLAGRPDNPTAAPTGKLPSPFQSADDLISLFAAKTFSAVDLAALIGAHTVSTQRFVDAALAGEPQDSTPGVWDNDYYKETLATDAPDGVFRFQSDTNLANSLLAGPSFVAFAAGDVGFAAWAVAYSAAYLRMSVLGVSDVSGLKDCTSIL